ncbi:MAG: tRNA (adenosine(37)-N6)-threonylcarbamoyltransferase complex dimerization subunit type 1 TsaB [Comamonadaceae bacterium]|nr:tRNA (adenosine(37)-N6)-threonylcarbamoyltransferase complex dimerization subunit type 1 TsaB [Comamonadaceae bacterium]
MKLLALESSSDRCSVALWCDGVLSSRCGDGAQTHSELMLPFVDALLAEAGLRVRSLDALAFGAGPGGFTGLRLACGVAQGLALAADLPVIAVGSLEAMALGSGREIAYVCVDARMNEVLLRRLPRRGRSAADRAGAGGGGAGRGAVAAGAGLARRRQRLSRLSRGAAAAPSARTWRRRTGMPCRMRGTSPRWRCSAGSGASAPTRRAPCRSMCATRWR